MFPFILDMENFRNDWLEPDTQELLRVVKKVVARLAMPVVTIEHFLLVACNSNATIGVLEALRINRSMLRDKLLEIIGPGAESSEEDDNREVFLSSDIQECVDIALAVVIYARKAMLIAPEHLLLSVLSREKVRALLGGLLPSVAICAERLRKVNGSLDMSALFRECIDLDVRTTFRVHAVLHTLTSSEHSLTHLADISGLDKSRPVIQSFIARVTQPQQALFGENSVPRCLLLVGPHSDQRRLIAEAVACEIGTPLLSLAFSKIVTLFAAAESLTIERSKEGGFFARPSGITPYGVNFVRDLFHCFFASAQRNTPAVLLIEDIDVVNRLGIIELRELLLTILLDEIDDLLDVSQHVVVMATAQHTQALDHLLARLRSSNFLDRIVLDQDVRVRSTGSFSQSDVCSSCHHPVAPKWSHCVYCGASLEKICSRCGGRKPNVEGAQFCFECGQTLDTQ